MLKRKNEHMANTAVRGGGGGGGGGGCIDPVLKHVRHER